MEDGLFVQKQKLSPEDLLTPNRFGRSIDILDDRLVIGASQGLNENGLVSGEAFSYEFNGEQWNLMSNLLSSDAGFSDAFGITVGIYGEGVIVGSIGNSEGAIAGGAVYFYEDVFVGLDDIDKLSMINIYPNPTRNYIHVTIPENETEVKYQVVNMNGQFLQSGVLNNFNNSLDVSNLSPGIYNIVFTSDSHMANRKFVVVR